MQDMFTYQVIQSVLPSEEFKSVQKSSRSLAFTPVPVGLGDTLHLAHVEPHIEASLLKAAEEVTGHKLECIKSFYRLNTKIVNNTIRIHSDAVIDGKKPDIAGVFYLETSDTCGTALFEHPEFGRDSKGKPNAIFKRAEGWKPYVFYKALGNSMFVYKADLYHSRYPFESYGLNQEDGRIVIVMFMRKL